MPIFCLFGPDGSRGKTAMAMSLAEKLKSSSINSPLSEAPIILNGISIPNRAKGLWQLIEFVLALPVLLFRFMLPSLLGYTVIAERCIPGFSFGSRLPQET